MNSSPPNPSEPLPLTQNENPWAWSHSGLPWMLLVKNALGASASNRNRTALPTRPSTKLAEPFSLGGANRISSIEAMTPAFWALTNANAPRYTSAAKTTILNTAPPLGASSPITRQFLHLPRPRRINRPVPVSEQSIGLPGTIRDPIGSTRTLQVILRYPRVVHSCRGRIRTPQVRYVWRPRNPAPSISPAPARDSNETRSGVRLTAMAQRSTLHSSGHLPDPGPAWPSH
jgi:hypothetical protein